MCRLVKNCSLQLDRNTELARAVELMMARAKKVYVVMIKGNKLIFKLFDCGVF